MSTPSSLGDLGYPVTAVLPYSTSTARFLQGRASSGAVDSGMPEHVP